MPLRIAHRGLPRQARENSLEGFALALAAGADGIELDVHASSDDVIVVHHDHVLADGRAIHEMTARELAGVEIAPGVLLPTLAQVCELVADRAELFVELKGFVPVNIEDHLARELADYPGRAAVHSFDHEAIRSLTETDFPRRLGILLDRAEPVGDIAERMRVAGALDVWPHWTLVTPELVARVHRAGGRVIAWTVNDFTVADEMKHAGVDGLCSDLLLG